MKESGLTSFLGLMVTILTDTKMGDQTVAFQGQFLDFDDNFVYVDRGGSGEIDTAVPIIKITAIEFMEDTPEIADIKVDEEEAEKLMEALGLLEYDEEDDDGGGTLQ